jgi:hypothetical protein
MGDSYPAYRFLLLGLGQIDASSRGALMRQNNPGHDFRWYFLYLARLRNVSHASYMALEEGSDKDHAKVMEKPLRFGV